ncbi:hypothetical protein GWI33_019358 [Rhynchophorus ferrugineus]|uniref:Uncharacterized protein n=1 Tax=Rhynchophorus ferrugineus TaxID=354439 RepID=A0A834HYG1_RHYFE|nr:hypothetical protein GWI33_019358 [Rhynchophorus ferrugineus]
MASTMDNVCEEHVHTFFLGLSFEIFRSALSQNRFSPYRIKINNSVSFFRVFSLANGMRALCSPRSATKQATVTEEGTAAH